MKLLLLLAVCISASATSAAPIRGLDPALTAHYSGEGGVFKCLDGSKTIAFDRVNDDFCDCMDGSDEPGKFRSSTDEIPLIPNVQLCRSGSSACANGRFWCRNKGHEPQSLSASFVDDGVCGASCYMMSLDVDLPF